MKELEDSFFPPAKGGRYWTILAPRLGNENSKQFSFLSLYVANKGEEG